MIFFKINFFKIGDVVKVDTKRWNFEYQGLLYLPPGFDSDWNIRIYKVINFENIKNPKNDVKQKVLFENNPIWIPSFYFTLAQSVGFLIDD